MKLSSLAVLALIAAPAAAQYSSDPLSNLAVAGQGHEEAQPKLVPTADGGCYVSWFASDPAGTPAFGYDVRLQRLDRAGNPEWGPNGVLIADRGFSSTQGYGLAVDSTGHALVTFRDDRLGGVQITAQRVTPAGLPLWGALGVQLTSTTAFLASPKICGTSDGHAIVAWSQGSSVRLQRLDADGVATWATDAVVPAGGGAKSLSDLQASDAGAAIVSYVSDSGSFGSPRHLFAQKISPAKVPLWAPTGVAILDSGSLQFGNFPTFASDGAGGAVFAWYTSSPSLQCWAQRVSAAGSELFPHNGVAVSTNASQLRSAPSLAFDAAEGELFVAWRETNTGQSQSGVSAQKFDAGGARLWGASGVVIEPVGGNQNGDVAAAALTAGSIEGLAVIYSDSTGFGQDTLRVARLDDAGASLGAPAALSSSPATKYRVTAAATEVGHVLCAWQDDGSGSADVLAQDVLPSGDLGGGASTTQLLGSGVNPVALTSVTPPRIGDVWSLAVDKSADPGAALTALFVYGASSPPLPIPQGELLVDVTSPLVAVNVTASAAGVDSHFLPIPGSIDLVGIGLACQAALVGGTGDLLTNGLEVMIGL